MHKRLLNLLAFLRPDPASAICAPRCTESVLSASADGFSCGDRIRWVIANLGLPEAEACDQVGLEFLAVCGPCRPSAPAPSAIVPTGTFVAPPGGRSAGYCRSAGRSKYETAAWLGTRKGCEAECFARSACLAYEWGSAGGYTRCELHSEPVTHVAPAPGGGVHCLARTTATAPESRCEGWCTAVYESSHCRHAACSACPFCTDLSEPCSSWCDPQYTVRHCTHDDCFGCSYCVPQPPAPPEPPTPPPLPPSPRPPPFDPQPSSATTLQPARAVASLGALFEGSVRRGDAADRAASAPVVGVSLGLVGVGTAVGAALWRRNMRGRAAARRRADRTSGTGIYSLSLDRAYRRFVGVDSAGSRCVGAARQHELADARAAS